jgi:hypothetical protein
MGDELPAAMLAENAAIYAYGILGVHLMPAPGDVAEARAAEQAHRDRRDALISRLLSGAPPAPAAYDLPFPVVDRPSAQRLAIHVEDGVAQAWRAVLPATEGEDRRAALAALTDAAVRATRWRRLAGVTPATVPFPGRTA